jgi:hypothetical protein
MAPSANSHARFILRRGVENARETGTLDKRRAAKQDGVMERDRRGGSGQRAGQGRSREGLA